MDDPASPPTPGIDTTPHRMMPAHEVDAMPTIARADVDGFSVRGQRWGTGRISSNASCGRRRRGLLRCRPRYRNGMNGLREISKLLRRGLRPRQCIGLLHRFHLLRWRLRARPKLKIKCCNSSERARGQHCAKDSSRGVHSGFCAASSLAAANSSLAGCDRGSLPFVCNKKCKVANGKAVGQGLAVHQMLGLHWN
jgi:hypothetical protein